MSKPFVVFLEIDEEKVVSIDPFDIATWLAGLKGVLDVTVWPAKVEDPEEFYEYAYQGLNSVSGEETEKLITEGECDGCDRSITKEMPGKECRLKPKTYHTNHCWGEHLGECIEED